MDHQRRSLVLVFGLLLSGCSQSTGIHQVDQVRDRVATALGIGSEFDAVGDAASRAARRAEESGRRGTPDEMGMAVAKGAKDVLCAGSAARKPAARRLIQEAENNGAPIPGREAAASAYRTVVGSMPELSAPCP